MLYPNFLFVSHAFALRHDTSANQEKSNVLAAIFFCAATGFAKASILLFYGRIFPSRTFKLIILCLVIFTVSYSLASVLVNVFSCKPVSGSWDLALATSAVCINRPVFYFAQAGLGIFTDFATLVAPLPFLWKLQMPVRQKIGVSAVLMMGGFVCIVSIIRLLSIKTLLDSTDLTSKSIARPEQCRPMDSKLTYTSRSHNSGPYVVCHRAEYLDHRWQLPHPSTFPTKVRSSTPRHLQRTHQCHRADPLRLSPASVFRPYIHKYCRERLQQDNNYWHGSEDSPGRQ